MKIQITTMQSILHSKKARTTLIEGLAIAFFSATATIIVARVMMGV